ncbi:MAG: amino acid permease [Flavobacteriaceae bacterium]|nr:amino acid permease [Flavobacteriaceae bacterium]
MAKGGKFGTMGGVFTPSILTILGVIMYMRLSWVIGNAGTLTAVIIIILMAHIVSVTTGLSVSSVATDKKIKGGGIYYMLSRSLGFPIGGAIGVTIFVATALSISLYLIGFAESALVVTKDWFGIEEITTNHLRIFGSIALLVIVTIAYISTSIAIKTQYIILALIALSLVSVFMGTTDGKGFDFSPIAEGTESVNFATLFGIFFPAVTGFTAGVAMSGDLKDPKKSIPWGTMLAIGTGLLVYVSLSLFIYYRIPTAELINNTNVLVEFSWIPQAVIAGIWGATLSSALGGILGGPRILQAMSLDGITPRFFAKGVGKDNEPRRALVLTFILAEVGILIGELDAIAGIVSMFYMAAYMFINLTCFLEQWASPDFRPTFRIPLVVSLVGAIATFLLMIQLDIVAALLSVVVMTFIFLWLTRKQLELGSGDVWQSVWSSVVKLGLKNLNKKETHQRNWEPNILLFSGGTNSRPHLLQFSKSIAGRNGMISNFDLIKNTSADTLFPKHQQSLNAENETDDSIFYRKQECQNNYDGIEAIAQTYGFSGIEPNTVLMGWSHNTENADKFTHMTNALHQLDYNIMFLDYDEQRGFGEKKKIDIWWRDLSQVSYLTVQLSKFLLNSKDWGGAEVRFIYLNNENSAQHSIKKAIERITSELKDVISIEIINNELEKKSFYEAVKVLSYDADLIIVDLPTLSTEKGEEFIQETNQLLKVLGTTLIVKASSHFNKGKILNLNFEKRYNKAKSENVNFSNDDLPSLVTSGCGNLQREISSFDERLQSSSKLFVDTVYEPIHKVYELLGKTLVASKKMTPAFYKEVKEVLGDIQNNRLSQVENELERAIQNHLKEVEKEIKKLPKKLPRSFSSNELEINAEDPKHIRLLKEKLQKKSTPSKRISLQKVAEKIYLDMYNAYFMQFLNGIGNNVYELDFAIKNWLLSQENKAENTIEIEELAEILKNQLSENKQYAFNELTSILRKLSNTILQNTDELLSIDDALILDKDKYLLKNKTELLQYPANFKANSKVLLNQTKVNFDLFRLRQALLPNASQIHTSLNKSELTPLNQIINNLLENIENLKEDDFEKYESQLDDLNIKQKQQFVVQKVKDVLHNYTHILPTSVEVIPSLRKFASEQMDLSYEKINAQKVVKYLTEHEIMYEINSLLNLVGNEVSSEIVLVENNLKLLQIMILEEDTSLKNEKEVIAKATKELKKIQQRLAEISDRLEQGVQRINSQCSELLSDEVIWLRAEQLNGIIRKEKTRKGINKYLKKIKHLPENLRDKTDEMIVKGIDTITKSKQEHRFQEVENPHSKWRNFVDSVSLTKPKEAMLPFYYYQLFTGKQTPPSEPLKNRAVEIDLFQKSHYRFIHGSSGAVLFLGERYSGKTYLIEHLLQANSFKNVYKITPPSKLLVDAEKTVNRAFANSLNSSETADSILQNMPINSVVVIEDLEKWWRRATNGNGVLELLVDLLMKYGKKVLFVLSCNIHSYQIIRKVVEIDTCLQESIRLNPLKITDIKEAILTQHKTSGMQYVWNGKEEKNMSFRNENQLMQRITTISSGNIGFSFHLWLSSIEEVKHNQLILKPITEKELPEVLLPKWENMILQIFLHKEIGIKGLYRIYNGVAKEEVQQTLQSLLRTQIVIETDERSYEINPFALLYVVDFLRKKNRIN